MIVENNGGKDVEIQILRYPSFGHSRQISNMTNNSVKKSINVASSNGSK